MALRVKSILQLGVQHMLPAGNHLHLGPPLHFCTSLKESSYSLACPQGGHQEWKALDQHVAIAPILKTTSVCMFKFENMKAKPVKISDFGLTSGSAIAT